jgi:hypothetical protein|tara:strand:- start:39 stop:302 length:264 start_codon:yes stop_codon:yes gene_type:complete
MILTTIDGIPLYSTIAEALQWAQSRGLNGYHTHIYQGQTGYMGGFTHSTATVQNRVTLSSPQQGSTTSASSSTTSSSGSSGGGGGGY